LISAAFWAAVGLAASLVTAAVGPRSASLGGRVAGPILGAVLAAVLTPVVAGIVFPLDYKGRIPPRMRSECLLVGGVGGALLAAGTAFGLKSRTIAAAS